MMRILIVNSFYYPHERGGAEKSVRILAENLVLKGHNVTVLTLSDDRNQYHEKINEVSIIRVPIMNIYHPNNNNNMRHGIVSKLKKIGWHIIDTYNILSWVYLKSILGNNDFDIIHTNNVSGFSVTAWNLAKEKKIPLVHTSRDYYLFNPNCTMYSKSENDDPNSLKIKCLSFLKKTKSNEVDAYVGISLFISNLHLRNGFFKKAKQNAVIYNGVGSAASVEYKENKKNKLENTNNKSVKLGYLGRLDDAKGIGLVIDYLKSSDIDFTLKIGGSGNPYYVSYLKEKCIADERFSFLGHVKIEEYFSEIDCLICSSLWNEPMGRVVIESFSYGVPVIGSRVGGISELIDVGRTGFLFNMNVDESFINAINSYIKSDRVMLSELCYMESEKYSDDTYVDNYIALYKKTISSYT